ncbi:MAG: ABC transporter substrate-binding protein [Desulfovibrionaceae bacterium]|jgi:ABC-type branched-subunit amino acid transport system substrate-binding protein|nr:ABC transporter substrate-binding protein [Desulfovibrionaceae bacterium]
MPRFTALCRLAPLLLLLALACACGPDETVSQDRTKVPGVTDGEILLGSSLALAGHASYLGNQTLRGALCCINQVNESGGVYGRTIRIQAYDDAYDPSHCMANTQRLIVQDDVFALFCYVGTPTTVKILPFVSEARIPLLGMFTGANGLRQPFNRYVINVRASYYQETEAAVAHLVEDVGIRDIAVFYQYDAYGFDGLTGTELALKKYGLEPVARAFYTRGTTNVGDAFQRIHDSKAKAVVMIGTYEPCAKFIHLAAESDYFPIFYTVSFVGAEELARRLGPMDREMVIMSQVVPPPGVDPASRTLLGNAMEYVDLLAKYYPEDRPNFVGLEGYVNARVLVEGLRRAGRHLTREGFIDALETMRDFRLGPGVSVSFGPTDHQGMDRVYFTWLEKGHFTMLKDWRSVRRPNREPAPPAGPGDAPRAAGPGGTPGGERP